MKVRLHTFRFGADGKPMRSFFRPGKRKKPLRSFPLKRQFTADPLDGRVYRTTAKKAKEATKFR